MFFYIRNISIIFLILSFSSCGDSKVEYEKQWNDKTNIEITRTLIKYNIQGCGQYKYKREIHSDHEYLLRCTRNGKDWTEYIVFGLTEVLMGPYKMDPNNN